MNHGEYIVGIDLGTTYSEVAAFVDGRVRVIGPGDTKMLPSCVGISPAGELLIGVPARNQQLLYPERTVRSIKRKMGSDDSVTLGDKEFTPQEISALILRELAEWAHRRLGHPVKKAVITVPAYFSDAQRNATREAGQLAGLDVVRILNEPTAASLAYGYGSDERRTVMIYDLGGGTFDVSIVTIESDITEVLASHGNNHLGGDDFDQLLVDRLLQEFRDIHDIDLTDGYSAAYSRLWWAAEEAKKRLSFEPFVKIREDTLVTIDGKPLHLETEISREEHEEMIRPLVESTLDSVSRAMDDAGKKPADLDAILLVGGSTRIPLVTQILEERAGIVPRQDVHPDLCVALGAGVLASRLAGHEVERVLVDVSPYSFGPSYLGERGGVPYPYCYHPIIRRNTPLPVTRTESYYTTRPYQTEVEIDIYQGDDPDALKNIPVGHFTVKGLRPIPEPNLVLCRMSLDVDGILKVAAIEKATGKSKHITIDNALQPKSEEEIAAARKHLQELYASRTSELDDLFAGVDEEGAEDEDKPLDLDPGWEKARQDARSLLERSRGLFDKMHDEDKEEAIDLHEQIESAIASQDSKALSEACRALEELLFFVEGK
ncbi:MAG: Hsp70 family protein [Deltaproteobacteria bacterium]|nr:Hsp70 family protein [Deltaproteobacteria bacterium]MBW2073375.1 Hsp70 family protein [Deltaproteobacteria bacterium]RLB83234.1 MAG: heat-shock protein Hsp70 [Deltaproteobacteria bacterium]